MFGFEPPGGETVAYTDGNKRNKLNIVFLFLTPLTQLYRAGAQSNLYTVRGTPYPVHCALYTVLYTVLYTAQCTLYSVHFDFFTVYCTLYTVHCNTYPVSFTLYTLLCTEKSMTHISCAQF